MKADRNLAAFVGMCCFFLGGLLVGSGVVSDHHRITECELRFELAATPTDSLTVMREHTYCEVGP